MKLNVFRAAGVLAALALAGTAGCSKGKDKDKEASGAAAATAAAGTPAKGAPAKTKQVNWAEVERVPYSKLQTLIPSTLLNLKRNDLSGSTHPGDDMHTEATGTFDGPNEAHLRIELYDQPVSAGDLIASKTSSFKGYPVVEDGESGNTATLKFVVGSRFIVRVYGENLKGADVRAAAEKLDLAKLESWKDEGVKK